MIDFDNPRSGDIYQNTLTGHAYVYANNYWRQLGTGLIVDDPRTRNCFPQIDPDYLYPLHPEIEVIPADKPKFRIGWLVYEEVGAGVVNSIAHDLTERLMNSRDLFWRNIEGMVK